MRALVSLVLLPLAACTVSASDGPAEGPAGTRIFELSGFDAVALAGSDDVIVKTGPFAVSATGSAKALDALDLRVDGSTLSVGRKSLEGRNWNDRGAVVTVTLPALTAAAVAGSGDMAVDRVRGETFRARVAGSGDLTVEAIEAGEVETAVAGSGDVRLTGRTRATRASVAGSGDVDASGLAAEFATVSVVGSGNVRARASRKASVNLTGSGDVEILGTADCTVSERGSGEVTCAR